MPTLLLNTQASESGECGARPGRRYQSLCELFLGNASVISSVSAFRVERERESEEDKGLAFGNIRVPCKEEVPSASCVNSLGTQHFSSSLSLSLSTETIQGKQLACAPPRIPRERTSELHCAIVFKVSVFKERTLFNRRHLRRENSNLGRFTITFSGRV